MQQEQHMCLTKGTQLSNLAADTSLLSLRFTASCCLQSYPTTRRRDFCSVSQWSSPCCSVLWLLFGFSKIFSEMAWGKNNTRNGMNSNQLSRYWEYSLRRCCGYMIIYTWEIGNDQLTKVANSILLWIKVTPRVFFIQMHFLSVELFMYRSLKPNHLYTSGRGTIDSLAFRG